MNWIKQNKLLSAYLALVFLAAVGLAFFTARTGARYAEISDNYGQQARELRRLQNHKPYPDQKNLDRLQQDHDTYAREIQRLEETVAKLVIPLEPSTPDGFQTELRETRDAFIKDANKGGMTLPENFHLGFDIYQVSLPINNEAATVLLRELRAVDLLLRILLEERVDQVSKVKLARLPEETRRASTDAAAAAKSGKGTRRPAAGGPSPSGAPAAGDQGAPRTLVNRHPIDVTFVCDNDEFRHVLNRILKAKQFFVTRLVRVENSQLKGPAREVPAPAPPQDAAQPQAAGVPPDAAQPGAAPGAAVPGATPAVEDAPVEDVLVPKQFQVLAGREKITVTARVEFATLPYAESSTPRPR